MHYENIRKATFLARPNRFIAHVELEGAKPSVGCADSSLRVGSQSGSGDYVVCHVKNTGRCRELLVPGATVYVQEWDNPARKTKFDLIAVEKGDRLINMDSQAPNKVFGEWAASGAFTHGLTLLKPEQTWGKSRFDFYFEAEGENPQSAQEAASPLCEGGRLRRGFVEVKGVTLEEGGAVYFPDAPTERGVKHVEELMACRAEGFEAYICFVIQMERVDFFSPNDKTHLAFGEALRRAEAAGVRLMAMDCAVTPDSLTLRRPVKIIL